MSIDGKPEFPHCTVFIVAAALVSHTLVLVGNIDTARTMHQLGMSSSGWSDVGLSLSDSMNKELDVLMTSTFTKLTGALSTILEIESDIDSVLGTIANATDRTVSTLQASVESLTAVSVDVDSTDSPASADLLAGGSADDEAGPLDDEEGCADGACEGSESEPTSFMQVEVQPQEQCGAEVCEDRSALLQGRVHMQRQGAVQVVGDEASGAAPSGKPMPESVKAVAEMRAKLHLHVQELVEKVKAGVHKLLLLLKPALLQIGKWLASMGDKMQFMIEEFSIVIDRVQKIIDEVMEKIAGPGAPSALLLENVFALFDVDGSGLISSADIHKVSMLYGITTLQHFKGEQLLDKYDHGKDKQLSSHEFSLMLRDASIPKASTVILRTYAKKLSEIAGKIASAQKRDEVAHSVAQYFTVVCAKNSTKVSWVAQSLTNGTLPVDFVADVLKQLAQNADNPGIEAIVDVGALVVGEMVKLNAGFVARAYKLLADPKWWHASGFTPADQPAMVKRVSHWVAETGGHAASPELLQLLAGREPAAVPGGLALLAHDAVRRRAGRLAEAARAAQAARTEALLSSETSADLFHGLLGRASPVGAGVDHDVARVVEGDAQAKPETLRFARWLAKNASETAQRFQHMCFDHAHASSNTVDSIATQIQGMLKKTQNFLRLMRRYSTPGGIKLLEQRVDKFVDRAVDEVLGIVDTKLNATLANATSALPKAMLIQQGGPIQGVWKDVIAFTKDLKGVLPTVIDNMKFSKREVSAVAANLQSIFQVSKIKGWPIFDNMKSLYLRLWWVYFLVFVLLTFGILFYGFWASGYWGGPAPTAEGTAPPASSLRERCLSCFQACAACTSEEHCGHVCFWSCLILANVVVLTMFLVSIILTMSSGLRSFVSAGCAEIYVLNDNTICVEIMRGIQKWLQTFWSAESFTTPLDSMCVSRTLMTCGVISQKLQRSTMFTVCGSMMAAIFTTQMIFESARLHEQARWKRMLTEKTLEFKDED